ncbi:MAG TPA: NADH-quinone oxidoreductase subunit L [Segeticoccus sp.]|nr:NADH-quinone oxidoreductase subunit L [Segeticoccus sp.]
MTPLLVLPPVPWPEIHLAPAQLVVLAPAAACLLGLWWGRGQRRVAATLAVLGTLVALGASAWQVVQVLTDHAETPTGTVGPLPVGGLDLPLTLLSDHLSALVAVAVAVVGLAVQGFSTWYLAEDPHYPQFAAGVSLFLAAMLLVVQTGDLVLLLVGWELMGWCSWLLIGLDSRRAAARRAAYKAFLVTRIGDLAFVIGLVILAVGAGTTSIPDVVRHWAHQPGTQQGALLTAAMVCLLSGIAGKSAQFPFQDWLPDAMEGPTPASALIHAATMVAAGTYVLARLFPILVQSGPARLLLAVVAGVTMVGSAVLAFGQTDLKRMLAWSTVSQVAIMLAALAVVPAPMGPDTGIVHFVSHAMFKALLFLGVGWLSVLVGGTTAAALSGGVRHFRELRSPLGVGLLALTGVPPFVGFVSKELVVGASEHGITAGTAGAWLVLVALFLTIPLTAAYCMRAWMVLAFRTQEERAVDQEVSRESHRPQEVDLTEMFDTRTFTPDPEEQAIAERQIDTPAWLSVSVLKWLTVVGGLVVLTPFVTVDWHVDVWLVGCSLLLMAGAAFGVRALSPVSLDGDAMRHAGDRVRSAFDEGWAADRAYLALVARPVLALARWVVAVDRDVIDAWVRGSAAATRVAGAFGEAAHRRRPSANLVWVLVGVLGVAALGVRLW